MKENQYMSIPQVAKILGISRIAVYRKVKEGRIKAIRIGRNYAIPLGTLAEILGKALNGEQKKEIEIAVKRTVKEYGEVIKMLGNE